MAMTSRQALQIASAACRNAVSLHTDARLLLRRKRYGRSLALATLGSEEAGKAMGYFLVAIEVIPADNLSRFLQSLERGRLSHQRKQAMSFIATLISEFRQRLNLAVDDRLGSKGDQAINLGDAQALRVELQAILKSMAPDLNPLFEEPSLEFEVEAVINGSWQTLRDRGFYVDFVDGVIRTPREIDEPSALSALERLQKTLRVVLPLTKMNRWPDLAISVIKSLLPKTEAEMEALWPKPEPERPTVDGNGLPTT